MFDLYQIDTRFIQLRALKEVVSRIHFEGISISQDRCNIEVVGKFDLKSRFIGINLFIMFAKREIIATIN